MLHAEQQAEDIGVEDGGVALCGLFGDGAGVAFRAGIVDGNVEPAEASNRLVDKVRNFRIVADIGLDKRRVRPRPFNSSTRA